MPHREAVPFLVQCKIDGIEKLATQMSVSLSTINAVQKVLREHGKIAQARAVSNVSGRTVTFNGKSFVVNRQTGKLARSIQVSQPNPLAVRVDASAEYASDVEQGTRGPVDLKTTKLAGKIVPLPAKKSQAGVSGFKAVPQFATTGKKMGTKYIIFRRVPGPGGKGWIIPMRAPRPFMAEAGEYTAPLLAAAVSEAFASYLGGDG